MSIWNHIEQWLPAPGQTEPARKFHAMSTEPDLTQRNYTYEADVHATLLKGIVTAASDEEIEYLVMLSIGSVTVSLTPGEAESLARLLQMHARNSARLER